MNATMAVMAREVVARRELLLLAAAAAVIAGVMPLMPGLESYDAADIRTVSSCTLALVLGWGLALLLGATVFGSDLAEGRLGFYFARPVSGFAVWWGRLAAAVVLIWAVEFIVLTPSLVGGGEYVAAARDGIGLAAFGYLVMPLLLFLVSHAVGIMVRARTAWLFLDLAGFVIFAVLAWVNLIPLALMCAEIALWVVAGALVASLLIATAVGGASGVVVGRVDLQRTHAAQALALWATLAVCLAGITGWSGWLRAFTPSQFDDIEVLNVSPDGRWAEVLGEAPYRLDVARRCLVSTVDHRWIPLPGAAATFWRDVVFSRDGSTAIWLGAELGDDPRALWWADLSRPDPSARSTNLVVSLEAAFVLSPDGDRVAILEEGTVSVYELGGERLLTAARLPDELHRATVLFDTPDSLRLYARSGDHDGHSMLIAEVEVATGEVVRTGEVGDLAKESGFALDSGLDYFVRWTRSAAGVPRLYSVLDASSGAAVVDLPSGGFWSFLADGRLVVVRTSGDGAARLIVEAIPQEESVAHDLERAEEWRICGEVLQGVVAMSRLEDPADRTRGLRVVLIDVDTGEVRELGANLRRARPWFRWLQGYTRGILWYGNQPAASRLFIDRSGALVRWDPESGELVHVVGGSGR